MFELSFEQEQFKISEDFLRKYNQVAPRYTSYPTAPEWESPASTKASKTWNEAIQKSIEGNQDLSLYFHIPFCKSACYYCACNIVVNPYNKLNSTYLEALKKEIQLISKRVNPKQKRKVSQVHFGGGTPTYLSNQELIDLFTSIREHFSIETDKPQHEISIEIDPRVTSFEQLRTLRKLGFNRVSLGIQDFDPQVQKAVNRIQSFELVSGMLEYCRELGYQSINFDLIYGLPFQNLDSFKKTIDLVLKLDPDRIALFNYAHVPSLRPFQKKHIQEKDLPSGSEKFLIFCEAMKTFSQNKYKYIGLDHFAKEEDELSIAQRERTLSRNFQGYTTKANSCDLLGMGMTSISSITEHFYTQNQKKLNLYLDYFSGDLDLEAPPIIRTFKLNPDDLLRKEVINNLLCNEELDFLKIEKKYKINFEAYFGQELSELKELEQDGLIQIQTNKIQIKTLGKIFLRNIALIFDSYLREKQPKIFSRTL